MTIKTLTLGILISCIGLLNTAFAELLAGNILPNANVEDAGADQQPSFWHHSASVEMGGVTQWSPAQGLNPSHSLRVKDDSTQLGLDANWRSYAIAAPASGTKMRFQWNWRYNGVTDQGILVAVRFFAGPVDAGHNTTGDFLGQFGRIATGSKEAWEKDFVDFVMPSNAQSLDVIVFSNSNAVTGDLFCDDLCVAPVGDVDLFATLTPTAIRDVKDGPVVIRGQVFNQQSVPVRLRVTTSAGRVSSAQVSASNGNFSARYPDDFTPATPLAAGVLFIDATTDANFSALHQAEAELLIYDSARNLLPDLPTAYTNDLYDAAGHTDSACQEWPVMRTLINLYLRSAAARKIGLYRWSFDLNNASDLKSFKNNVGIFEYDQRDRDWSTPLGLRVRRTFWQSVYNTWFNSTNDNPIDGNPDNMSPSNYVPYAFSNDYTDTLIMYLLRSRNVQPLDDNFATICREGTENLLAMQHKETDNFALKNSRGIQFNYTAGAFRYGVFATGDVMNENNGWFYNPNFNDYYNGGVFNGRCSWGLGIALQQAPHGSLAPAIKQALQLSIKFCLQDALGPGYGYAFKTAKGNVYWRDAGEHAYLLIGMLAACSVAPDLPVAYGNGTMTMTLREACHASLNALVDLEKSGHMWSKYPNVDSMAIVALADGAELLHDDPDAVQWVSTARNVADGWMAARVDPQQFPGEVIHFGLRPTPTTMTYTWDDHNFIFFYQSGHWIHALARLYAVSKSERYRQRAEAIITYLCGRNPWGLRLLTEIGGVYNWVEDRNGDGVEDNLKNDLYPESTDFCQIGILYYLKNMIRSDTQAACASPLWINNR